MKKLRRLTAMALASCLALGSVPAQASTSTEDFQGLVVSYDEGVTVKLFSGFDNTTVIEPSLVENNTNYYPNLSGKYRVQASRSGYITVSENIYISDAEATTRMEKHYSLVKRDGAWDPSYARKLTDEALASMPSDPALWPQYAAAFTTPVFAEGRSMHKFTTQTEMENFLAGLDGNSDKMYVYSLGTTPGTPAFDIPLVIFTETDLSSATTLEEAAALIEANGKITVHYQGQIHGNEPAGGEAALGMIAMLDTTYGDALLDKMNIYVIPRLNPDGAYNDKRAIPTTSVDPNRDYLNLDSYEVSRTIYAMNLFNPEVVVDGHEYTVNLDSVNTAFMDIKIHSERSVYATEDIIQHADGIANSLFANMQANNLTSGWYNNCVSGSNPNVGTGYVMQRGCYSILLESYGIYGGTYNMARRVAAQVSAMDGILQYIHENSEAANKAVNDQWDILIWNGKTYGDGDQGLLAVESQMTPEYNTNGKKLNLATGAVTSTVHEARLVNNILRSRENPTAYLVPADHESIDYILQHVKTHGLSYYKIPANSAVPVQHVGGDTTEAVITEEQRTVFVNGAYVFPMDQRYARILGFLMEPDVTWTATYSSSFAQAGIFTLTDGEYPVYRYVRDLNADGTIDYVSVPGAPENLTATVPTDGANGSISGLDSAVLYEYRLEGESSYTALPAGTTQITGLAEGKYYVRIRATADTEAGADAVVSLYKPVNVYLDQTNGSDDNDGLAESTAVATLDKAYSLLSDRVVGDNTGTIVFVSEYALSSKINDFPSHSFPVVLTSKTGAEGFNYTYTATSATNGEINLNGPTTFRKLTISNNGRDNYVYLTAGGHKLVIEEDVITAGTKKFMLVGGRKDGTSTNSDMTVSAGTFDVIYLATHKGSHNGPINFTMTGGTANSYITPSYSGTVTGDISIYAKNANMGGVYLGNTSKNNVTGNVTVTFGKDVTLKSFYAGSRDAGNVTGTVTVIADGIDLTSYTLNGKANNSTGTIGGLKLVLNQGELADVASSFVTRDGVDIVLGCDQIESAKLNYSCNLYPNGYNSDITTVAGKTLTVYLDYTPTVPVDTDFEMPDGEVLSVDITEAQTVVLGNDGYYHLGSYAGPILYMDLNSDGFTLASLLDAGAPNTMRGEKIPGQDGELYCYDYLDMIAYGDYYTYAQTGDYYPLNADLMAFFQDFGTAQGWYTEGLSNFPAINKDGVNADSAWLVAAVYIEGNNGSATDSCECSTTINGETVYASLANAIATADSNSTISLLSDCAGEVIVKKNITLDLNGNTITGNVTVVNGQLIDSAGAGSIQGAVSVPKDNRYMPLLVPDTEDTYRLFAYTAVKTTAPKEDAEIQGALNFWFDLDFADSEAYTLLKGNSNLKVNATLSWTENGTVQSVEIAFDETIKNWAAADHSQNQGLYVQVTGIPDFGVSNITVTPYFEATDTGIKITMDSISHEIPQLSAIVIFDVYPSDVITQ